MRNKMALYNIIRRTGDLVGYGVMAAFSIDALRHLAIGSEENYQIAVLEGVAVLGIGASKYVNKRRNKKLKDLENATEEARRCSLAFIAKSDQVNAEIRDAVKNFNDNLDDDLY